MSARASRAGSTFRDYRLPLAASLLLHAAVVLAVSRVPWPDAEGPRREVPRVIWLGDRITVAPMPEPPGPPIEPVEPPEPADSPPPDPLDPIVPPPVEPPPSEPPPPEEQPLVEPVPAPQSHELAPPEPDELAPPERATRGRLIAPGIDFERARQEGIAETIEQLERENGHVKFTDEDLYEKPVAEAPNPRAEMFNPRGRSRGPAGLQPGRGRSRLANRVAELCNALTGGGLGFDLFGFGGTLCAEAGPGADFFADLRPRYMESLPVCAESTPERPELAAQASEFPTIKCRLVPKDELSVLITP